jgi:hypothetical protein
LPYQSVGQVRASDGMRAASPVTFLAQLKEEDQDAAAELARRPAPHLRQKALAAQRLISAASRAEGAESGPLPGSAVYRIHMSVSAYNWQPEGLAASQAQRLALFASIVAVAYDSI